MVDNEQQKFADVMATNERLHRVIEDLREQISRLSTQLQVIRDKAREEKAFLREQNRRVQADLAKEREAMRALLAQTFDGEQQTQSQQQWQQ